MSTDTISGVNFTLEGETIEFFDAKGAKLSETSWIMNTFLGAMVECDPVSITDRVRACIDSDVAAGKAEQIAMLQLAPCQAVIFFLEGQLNRSNLDHAVEGPGFIDLPDVNIAGRRLTVRILADPQHTVATADADGNVI